MFFLKDLETEISKVREPCKVRKGLLAVSTHGGKATEPEKGAGAELLLPRFPLACSNVVMPPVREEGSVPPLNIRQGLNF